MKSSPIVIAALLSVAMAIRVQKDDEYQMSHELIASNADIGVEGYKDLSDSWNDKEIQMPKLAQTYTLESRDIIDADGDGVEDNQHKTQGELDRFRKKVFDPIEEMHNTHNGEYPGHVRAGESPMPAPAPSSAAQHKSTQSLVQQPPVSSGALTQAQADDNLESLLQKTEPLEETQFTNDAEYLQIQSNSNSQFSFLINNIQSPEDLAFLETQKTNKAWRRRITDADGDGIEDNVKFTHDELDEFYEPLVFGFAEDINNTHHGKLPGHRQLEFTMNQGEPEQHWFEKINGDFPSA